MSKLKGDLLLLLTALIWGFAFVAQRVGMNYIGPFTFNGIRFFIGAIALLPLLFYYIRKDPSILKKDRKIMIFGGILTGVILFIAASFQQVGIVYTTAGKAGFITGLYIIIVPFISIFLKRKIKWNNWAGAFISTVGLYFLSGTGKFTLEHGDFLVCICACFWAVHILIIGWLSPKMNAILLSCIQFYVCSVLSLITGFTTEHISLSHILNAAIPILYGGLFSIGIAYTLQVVAQKSRPPEDASIILSLEALFAAIGGWIILGEIMNFSGISGSLLMLTGIIISQVTFKKALS